MGKKQEYNYQPLQSEYGKMPPQALDLEEAVLGSLMLEKEAFVMVSDLLKPECFYKEAHQKIYQAIQSLAVNSEPIDLLTVSQELKRGGNLETVGGYYSLAQLTSRVASAVHIEFHARIIVQKYIQRELIRASTEIQAKAYDDATDVADLVDMAQKMVFEISEGNIKKETAPIDVLIDQALKHIAEIGARDGMSGTPSGFSALDEITSGWQPSDLVIIAARPSMGKTAFVLSMARNMAVEHETPIAIFSLEMSSMQLVNRLISSETELGSEKIRNGRLSTAEWQQVHAKIAQLVKAPIYVDDTPALSIFELRAKCRRLQQRYGIKMLIIDYLQLMTAGTDMRGNREQEVSTISRQLKIIAKELNIPVIALSQLNRSLEQRDEKKPMLSDLRESGAIEQDADMVLFIHRPERFGIHTDDEGNSLKGIAQIIIAKHRNGTVGEVTLRFRGELALFTNLESDSPFANTSSITVSKPTRRSAAAAKTSKKMTSLASDTARPAVTVPLNTGFEGASDFLDKGNGNEPLPF
ncbi:MAG: replicative DNA helicase [Odoribacteraceae bacterium]|jgi:replicative DNA helicase|nr:replicative DNA helicase [Odoribacteraceae bacterium]